ncbi:MAG: hypothetical protein UU61_C0007G0002 [Parcubacteria group bacterium GW2011_GWB1_41_4]|nr:MAG: hypothetical protein UU61_C0007G0002 [Parcubacteria group bacterium GW2011_GWB1_41_4]
MCKYNDPGWECELCGARNETGSNPCWQCKGDSRKVRAIRTMLALVGIVLCAKPEITVIQVPNHAGSVRVILKKPKR